MSRAKQHQIMLNYRRIWEMKTKEQDDNYAIVEFRYFRKLRLNKEHVKQEGGILFTNRTCLGATKLCNKIIRANIGTREKSGNKAFILRVTIDCSKGQIG